MVEFRYKIEGMEKNFAVGGYDLRLVIEDAKRTLIELIQKEGYEIDKEEEKYIESKIAVSHTRDYISKGYVDLGEIKVKPAEGGGVEITLVNLESNEEIKKNFNPDQSVGIIKGFIRKNYVDYLRLEDMDKIQLVKEKGDEEILSTTKIRDLGVNKLYWGIK
jgi:exosome complex RNA-binding protein Csl4